MSSLVFAGVSKRFGELPALDTVSFSVEPGEVFGYLGPNGAGKTTTLRICLGLMRPDAGSVSVLGRPPADATSRGGVGFLPGEFRVWGGMRAIDVLDHFARFRPHHPPRLRGQLMEALAVDENTARKRIRYLSHGTRQKIGLIIAMQHDPALLLLDEPSLGLDPLIQRAFRDVVRDFAARGRTVMLSSHVLSEVESMCERVAILREGRLVATERIVDLRRQLLRPLSVHFRGHAPRDLDRIDGVERAEVAGDRATLWIRGDVNAAVRRLAECDIEQLVFPEPQLEHVFLSYYGNQARDA